MPLPTRDDVERRVRKFIRDQANFHGPELKQTYELQQQPLMMDSTQLAKLTLELRQYVKSHKPDATVLVKEVKKSGLIVSGVFDLLFKKLGI